MPNVERKDISQLQMIAQDILQEAKRLGATQAEVDVATNKGFSVSAQEGEVETVEYHLDKVIDVTVYIGQRSGSASLSDFQPQAIKKAVAAACHIAKYTDEDPAAGLAEKEDLAFNYPHLQTAFPWQITVEKAIELACECEQSALQTDKRIMSAETAAVSTIEAFHLYANSHGFMGYYPYTHHEISCVAVGKDDEEMQRDHSYAMAVNPSQLASAKLIGQRAAEKTVNRLGARRLNTMKTPVLFCAEEARDLFKYFLAAISGNNLYRQSSFLLNHLDKKIFPDFMSIQEKPHLPFAMGSVPFDSEGVATRDNKFVEAGRLHQYSLSTYAARKLGMKTTGNAGGVHNLVVHPGQHDFGALLKQMHKGLLVTEMMGNGVSVVTGDYSRGAAGFWVEDGKIQYPVHEITIAGNLRDMFANVAEIGNDVDVRGNIRTGSVLISEMTVAGE